MTMTDYVSRTGLLRALWLAGLLLATATALRWLAPAWIDPGLARRLLGALMGAVVVVSANAVPKTLTPLARLRCAPAAEQALRRFTGFMLVAGGAGYALAWLFAPLGVANLVAAALLGIALALVALRWAAVLMRRPS
jgi:hypothetical protein